MEYPGSSYSGFQHPRQIDLSQSAVLDRTPRPSKLVIAAQGYAINPYTGELELHTDSRVPLSEDDVSEKKMKSIDELVRCVVDRPTLIKDWTVEQCHNFLNTICRKGNEFRAPGMKDMVTYLRTYIKMDEAKLEQIAATRRGRGLNQGGSKAQPGLPPRQNLKFVKAQKFNDKQKEKITDELKARNFDLDEIRTTIDAKRCEKLTRPYLSFRDIDFYGPYMRILYRYLHQEMGKSEDFLTRMDIEREENTGLPPSFWQDFYSSSKTSRNKEVYSPLPVLLGREKGSSSSDNVQTAAEPTYNSASGDDDHSLELTLGGPYKGMHLQKQKQKQKHGDGKISGQASVSYDAPAWPHLSSTLSFTAHPGQRTRTFDYQQHNVHPLQYFDPSVIAAQQYQNQMQLPHHYRYHLQQEQQQKQQQLDMMHQYQHTQRQKQPRISYEPIQQYGDDQEPLLGRWSGVN